MLTANPSNLERLPAETGPIEQLLVMHCLKDDSVLGREGFSVRAASPGANDVRTLDWAVKLEQYELPIDMKTGALLANQAPRRLALAPGPPGRVALIHTAYLPEDTVGRSHSFISQILLVSELSTIPAISAWGSADWLTSEYPRGETKVLPVLEHVPSGNLINDAALTSFLSKSTASADQSLARTFYPVRVESNSDTRNRWIRAALQAFLRAGERGSKRARVCVLAEPGSVALLIYAIARLLPPQIADTFWFSTYEPPHTSLRENKVARVIGGYAKNGIDRGETDSLGRWGYVINTFRELYPDLVVDSSWPLEGLLKLVADGDWSGVDDLRDLWARDPRAAHATAASLSESLRVRPLIPAFKQGSLDAKGLLELKRNRYGEGLLAAAEFRRPAWEAVRRVWTQPGIREAFTDTLREHVDELLDDVKGQLGAGPSAGWHEAWDVLKPLIPPDRRVDELTKILVGTKKTGWAPSADERRGLLDEWSQEAPANAAVPSSLHWLLRAANLDEWNTLVGSSRMSGRLAGLAACLALSESPDWAATSGFLKNLPEDRFHALVSELATFELRKNIYERLRSDGGLAKLFIDRLIRLRDKLPDQCAEEVLSAIGCDEPAWRDYWLKNGGNHFAAALTHLAADSPLARRLWDAMLGTVTADSLVDAATSNLGALIELRNRFPDSLSQEQIVRLDGWSEINLALVSPPKPPQAGMASGLARACAVVGVTREDLIDHWFRAQVLTAPKRGEMRERAEKLGRSLLGFYETEDAAIEHALKLGAGVRQAEVCRLCKTELFNAIVSADNRDRLAGKFEYDLRDTEIRPKLQVDLLQKGGRAKGTRKGLGVGRFRLQPQAVPYVVTFLSGGLFFSVLLLLVPQFLAYVTSWSASSVADALDQEKKAKNKLSEQLEFERREHAETRKLVEDQNTTLSTQKANIDSLTAKLNEANLALKAGPDMDSTRQRISVVTPPAVVNPDNGKAGSDRAPLGDSHSSGSAAAGAIGGGAVATSPTPSAANTGGATATSIRKQLRSLIVDKPLSALNIAKAQELAAKLHRLPAEGAVNEPDELVRGILSDLSMYNVPTSINASSTRSESKTDFAFVNSHVKDRTALATLTYRPDKKINALTVYFLDLTRQPIWAGQPDSINSDTVISSSAAGDVLLLGTSAPRDAPFAYYAVKSAQFYKDNSDKKQKEALSLGRQLSFSSRVGMKPTISDDGKWCAVAEFESSQNAKLPNIRIGSTDPNFKDWAVPLDFQPISGELKPIWTISGMSFDKEARSLVVGFAEKPFVVAFELRDLEPSKAHGPVQATQPIKFSGPPLGWAHCSDGRHIAVLSNGQIFLDDLATVGSDARQQAVWFDNDTKSATCLAVGPRSALLATGNEDGTIAIRPLANTEATGGSQPRFVIKNVVMRLEHVGPIQKLAFSPDGRVLAALAKPRATIGIQDPDHVWKDRSSPHPGVIRLWLTDNWEPIDK